MLFEVAWEVCNQVGGIYQVIRSKAPSMVQRWGDRYLLIGPYDPVKAQLEFEPAPVSGWLARALTILQSEGLSIHHGRWLVSGKPRVLLIDAALTEQRVNELKYRLWEDHSVESPPSDPLYDQVLSFAEGVVRVFDAICRERSMSTGAPSPARRPIVAHFHEWMGGMAIPMLARRKLPIATVFTTHATLLGRYIASSDHDFYERLPRLFHEAEARRFGIRSQHAVERACARASHVFTTVSSITAEECAALLGRSVDAVLPNGLNVERYNLAHDQQRAHAEHKEAIHRFVMGHFFPSYSFDLDKTLYLFSSGRFEPRNKGFDLCLETMARLNAELKAARDGWARGLTVVFFIVSRRPTRSLHPLALEKHGVLEELREVCARITESVGERLFRRAAAGERLRLDSEVDEYWALRYVRTQHAMRSAHPPPVVTHVMADDKHDPVLVHLRELGLFNAEDDPVKVVYHPDFINPANPLWGIEYDQFARGCHLGLFPSAYEPWGYTPLECLAMGIPSVTSDLAGFGRYVMEMFPDHDRWGLKVLRRRGRGFHEAAADLCAYLIDFCRLDRRGRITLRNEVDRRSWEFDWEKLGRAYHAAHDRAAERFCVSHEVDAGLVDLGAS
ncbi:MAG: glycosyltransferase [Phycisphaerae bacterium]|nr:glycosyltransferase [Phycisphaerae bacterium]